MESTIWLTALGLGFVALAALLVVILSRVQALFRIATGVELKARLDTIGAQNERLERELRTELAQARGEAAQNAQTGRAELAAALNQFTQALQNQLAGSAHVQNERLASLTQSNELRLEAVRATVEQRLEVMRSDNAQKLEHIRTDRRRKAARDARATPGRIVQARVRPSRAGSQGTGRDADAGGRRRRSEEGSDQHQDARDLGRSSARKICSSRC